MNFDNELPSDLIRPERSENLHQPLLFEDLSAEWEDHWFGMPEFNMKDTRPEYRIAINFLTAEDIKAFAELTGIRVTPASDSGWYPHQPKLTPGKYYYTGPKTDSKYPVCLPSKGRAACQTTGGLLEELGVTHRFFVEEVDYDDYVRHLGEARVIKMPFSNLGQGSVPARNFIWDWAKEHNHKRHWVLDDNITTFSRTHNNRRLRVRGGGFFNAMEDFVDRYSNIALAGPHDQGFVTDRQPDGKPFTLNSRVYSCTLIDTSLPHRWRGRYNEDTDLSLRLLKEGYCTVLFRALCMNKGGTAFSKGRALPGGNTDNVYNTGDYRLAFAKSLEDQHPDVVKVVWRFNRWHHLVDYSPFKNNKLKLVPGIVRHNRTNNYGMTLVQNDDFIAANGNDVIEQAPPIEASVLEDFLCIAAEIKNTHPTLYRYCVSVIDMFNKHTGANVAPPELREPM